MPAGPIWKDNREWAPNSSPEETEHKEQSAWAVAKMKQFEIRLEHPPMEDRGYSVHLGCSIGTMRKIWLRSISRIFSAFRYDSLCNNEFPVWVWLTGLVYFRHFDKISFASFLYRLKA